MASGTPTTAATPGETTHNAMQIAAPTQNKYDFILQSFYKLKKQKQIGPIVKYICTLQFTHSNSS